MATYYIDFVGGNDANSGTSTGAPWQRHPQDNLATGLSLAKEATIVAGDVFIFKGGVIYDSNSNIAISKGGAAGNNVIYDGNTAGTFGVGQARIEKSCRTGHRAFLFVANTKYVTIQGFLIQNIGGYTDAQYAALPPTPLIGSEGNRDGIGIEMPSRSYCQYITIKDCVIIKIGNWRHGVPFTGANSVAGTGIRVHDSQHIIIDNCDISFTTEPIGIWATELLSDVEVKNCQFHENIEWCIDISAMRKGAVTDPIPPTLEKINVHHCTFYNYHQFDVGNWKSAGGGSPHVNGVYLRTNSVANSYQIWRQIKFHHCLFYEDNRGSSIGGSDCIQIAEGSSADCFNNIVLNDWHGNAYFNTAKSSVLVTSLVPVARIFNNTFWAGQSGHVKLSSEDKPNRIYKSFNNIFYKESSVDNAYFTWVRTPYPEFDYDLYFDPNWTVETRRLMVIEDVSSSNPLYKISMTTRGMEIHMVYGDPKFVNDNGPSPSKNMRLQAGSAAIGTGKNLSAEVVEWGCAEALYDWDGKPRPATGPWDIGAFQFEGTPVEPPEYPPVYPPEYPPVYPPEYPPVYPPDPEYPPTYPYPEPPITPPGEGFATVTFSPGLPGECTPVPLSELTTRLTQLSQVTSISNVSSFYNFGDTEPSPENRLYPWLRTIAGQPDKWYVYRDGAWRAENPSHIWYAGTALGSSNVYTANTALPYPSTVTLTPGDVFLVRILHTNTLSSTLAINGIQGTIQNAGSNLVAGELVSPQTYIFMWDGARFRVLNATVPDRSPVNVYATSAWTSESTTDLDLSFTLPTGKTRWTSIKMYATAKVDSQLGASPVSVEVTFKWNSGEILDTSVSNGFDLGSGNSGKELVYDFADVQDYPHWQWEGPVPEKIWTITPFTVRATVALTGSQDVGNWMFWAVAVAA